jgi:hypothetical protein
MKMESVPAAGEEPLSEASTYFLLDGLSRGRASFPPIEKRATNPKLNSHEAF